MWQRTADQFIRQTSYINGWIYVYLPKLPRGGTKAITLGRGKATVKPISGGNPDLASFTPRELIEELKARGYKGKLTIEREIVL